ncbi:hypothetical protein [Streptomyces subrutilus]|uniref:Secreted protein n=1 Tax=Streptomyces subrutilus TaxID=36818 RepID=A0A5P2UMX6_9ACTN|nr:hypothetical protein [Streptomyces subrutilus]QEU79675.1 hypothetical protein CP968_16245 [Streptomyces subrutilus]WSJ31079.1 hypothetical protein OG479_18355 [Streptomyces subrutilus]
MIGRRHARTTFAGTLSRALTVVCVVLLSVFAAGPAAASAAESRPASTAPAEPTEGQSDPAADPEVRAAVRTAPRGVTGVRRLPSAVFHVKPPQARPAPGAPCTTVEAAPPQGAVRSVVLRC